LQAEEVFPQGVTGVDFLDLTHDRSPTVWGDVPCYAWRACGDRMLADNAYASIMKAMAGQARGLFRVAVHGRFFRNPNACPIALADRAVMAAAETGATEVFLLADRHRDTITQRMADLKITMAEAPELTADMNRDWAGMFAYLADWSTLISAPIIVALNGPSTALHPARAAGRRIIYA
jgi:hypothetical protein